MRLACVQCDLEFDSPAKNAAFCAEKVRALAADESCDFFVFPEAFLTGYCVASADEALQIALPFETDAGGDLCSGHDSLATLIAAARETKTYLVCGFIGLESERLYNCALFARPDGTAGIYRKTHLPVLGADRFMTAGRELPVFETPFGRVGTLICFDQRLPEPTRALALRGADLVVLPTNWPVGAEVAATHISIARAAENRIFFASCNRVGQEKGFTFIGQSGVYGLDGTTLAKAGREAEDLIVDLDLSLARQKRRIVVPGEYETDAFGARQPELYGILGETAAESGATRPQGN
ncbi:MAG: carbon-nitrogen hydrolase family protein [Fimbriimonadaceae bacterium]|nr:carbon-nitrogen hydrolase family protein [Fimbriimonadaceae bacterium]QYK55174.1 MAG: carbon-nitrogen hydrolase family protein [Fimbriimonadaceae bacterium]